MTIEEVKKIHPTEGDYIVFKYNPEKINFTMTHDMFLNLQKAFPNNQVIAIPVGTELEVDNKEKIYNNLCEIYKRCIESQF